MGEITLDLMWFLVLGPAGDIDFKITGNGEPPAAGYTPTVRPIWIKGAQGLRADVLNVSQVTSNPTLSGAQPAVGAAIGPNTLTAKHIAKAFATVTTDGTGGHSVSGEGLNVASVTIHPQGAGIDIGYVELTWTDAFDSADYVVTVNGISSTLAFIVASVGAQTASTARVYLYDLIGAARIDPATQVVSFHVTAHGKQ